MLQGELWAPCVVLLSFVLVPLAFFFLPSVPWCLQYSGEMETILSSGEREADAGTLLSTMPPLALLPLLL